MTSLGPGFRYPPQWSPDSKKLAFIDQAMRIRIYDDGTGKVTDVDKSPDWMAHGQLEAFRFQWSPDSRWIAYARPAVDQQQRDLPVRHESRHAGIRSRADT